MSYTIVPERPEDNALIEPLLDLAFGPERQQKTVYRLRDGIEPVAGLSFVVLDAGGSMQGNIRYWPTLIAGRWPAVMLGPLAVHPARRGEGLGKALVRHSLERARALGHRLCFLVGDPEYYLPFGFQSAVAAGLQLPGWVEPRRFLVLELVPGALAGVQGMIGRSTAAPDSAAAPISAPPATMRS
jgi:predicted N-acetyltransferase YhbS